MGEQIFLPIPVARFAKNLRAIQDTYLERRDRGTQPWQALHDATIAVIGADGEQVWNQLPADVQHSSVTEFEQLRNDLAAYAARMRRRATMHIVDLAEDIATDETMTAMYVQAGAAGNIADADALVDEAVSMLVDCAARAAVTPIGRRVKLDQAKASLRLLRHKAANNTAGPVRFHAMSMQSWCTALLGELATRDPNTVAAARRPTVPRPAPPRPASSPWASTKPATAASTPVRARPKRTKRRTSRKERLVLIVVFGLPWVGIVAAVVAVARDHHRAAAPAAFNVTPGDARLSTDPATGSIRLCTEITITRTAADFDQNVTADQFHVRAPSGIEGAVVLVDGAAAGMSRDMTPGGYIGATVTHPTCLTAPAGHGPLELRYEPVDAVGVSWTYTFP